MQHAFLILFLPSLHDYDVKRPNFTFYEGREQHEKKIYFFYLNLETPGFWNSTREKFANISQIERDGMSERRCFTQREFPFCVMFTLPSPLYM